MSSAQDHAGPKALLRTRCGSIHGPSRFPFFRILRESRGESGPFSSCAIERFIAVSVHRWLISIFLQDLPADPVCGARAQTTTISITAWGQAPPSELIHRSMCGGSSGGESQAPAHPAKNSSASEQRSTAIQKRTSPFGTQSRFPCVPGIATSRRLGSEAVPCAPRNSRMIQTKSAGDSRGWAGIKKGSSGNQGVNTPPSQGRNQAEPPPSAGSRLQQEKEERHRRIEHKGHKGKQKIQADEPGMKRCFGLDSGRACARITLACVPHTPSRNHACHRHACPCGASPKHRCGLFTQKRDDLISLCSLCPLWPRVLVFL
jgi:hypothetical protein